MLMTKLTTTQAAAKVGRDASQVRRWCESGKLAATKLGHIWVIDSDVLAEFKVPKRGPPFKKKTIDC